MGELLEQLEGETLVIKFVFYQFEESDGLGNDGGAKDSDFLLYIAT